ncbi:MAG TPA: NAD-dependent succinate-semialdehyde dehydrogenase [Gaiellaceae bacterium]|nr:NAD-dependent succinate-semialdehyde dehydrogenase [Gaiellaceae bacterium]
MSATADTTVYTELGLYIDGAWTESAEHIDVHNPATEEVIGRVPHATVDDLERAVSAAVRGFAIWRDLPVDERTGILLRAAELIRSRAARIGEVMTLEQGKPLPEARGEAVRVAKALQWEAEEGRRAYGRVIPIDNDTLLTVHREPVGPVAAFTPWNFPAGSPMRKISAALSAGCSLVIKASEETPGTACELVRCFEEAGVPAGVLNLVFGDPPAISEYLIAHPSIRFIAFTGSVPVGKHLAGLAAQVMKPSIMELGGHAPVIVCDDSDASYAARMCVTAKFINAGQVCTSPSRFYVHESLYDAFVDAFSEATKAIKVGNGLEEGVKMGPLANPRRLAAIEKFVEQANANIVTGGKRIDGPGWFYEPTVLTDVPTTAELLSVEPFGPVAPIMPFTDLDEAIERANALPYGLAAYGFTKSSARAAELSRRLEAGILSINHASGSVPEAPSGGVKESGYGREGGHEGLEGYLITKRVHHKLIS